MRRAWAVVSVCSASIPTSMPRLRRTSATAASSPATGSRSIDSLNSLVGTRLGWSFIALTMSSVMSFLVRRFLPPIPLLTWSARPWASMKARSSLIVASCASICFIAFRCSSSLTICTAAIWSSLAACSRSTWSRKASNSPMLIITPPPPPPPPPPLLLAASSSAPPPLTASSTNFIAAASPIALPLTYPSGAHSGQVAPSSTTRPTPAAPAASTAMALVVPFILICHARSDVGIGGEPTATITARAPSSDAA
mmetsp:Transcript_13039/g.27525  ORF Transcript_13039/g.27525 Transcript_13039/m.27525 type:complete len:253 (-) Transcript_13039:217-975(-)